MMVFASVVDATFAAFEIDAIYTATGGDRTAVITQRPDTIVGFGDTHIHAETATFEVRASEAANPRPSDGLTVGEEVFVIQASASGVIPSRLVWTLDTRPAWNRFCSRQIIASGALEADTPQRE